MNGMRKFKIQNTIIKKKMRTKKAEPNPGPLIIPIISIITDSPEISAVLQIGCLPLVLF
jgi:hypothetical protein